MKTVLGRGLEALIPISTRDSNVLDEAESLRRRMEMEGLSQKDLSRQIGKSRPHIANTLRLLELPDPIKSLVVEGKISSGHARALLAVSDSEKAFRLAKRISEEALSVREIEELVRRELRPTGRRTNRRKSPIEEKLEYVLGATVRVHAKRKNPKLEISFRTPDKLKEFTQLLAESLNLKS